MLRHEVGHAVNAATSPYYLVDSITLGNKKSKHPHVTITRININQYKTPEERKAALKERLMDNIAGRHIDGMYKDRQLRVPHYVRDMVGEFQNLKLLFKECSSTKEKIGILKFYFLGSRKQLRRKFENIDKNKVDALIEDLSIVLEKKKMVKKKKFRKLLKKHGIKRVKMKKPWKLKKKEQSKSERQ